MPIIKIDGKDYELDRVSTILARPTNVVPAKAPEGSALGVPGPRNLTTLDPKPGFAFPAVRFGHFWVPASAGTTET